MYKARTGGGRKSVSGERYDPTEDDLDVTAKVVPKSDEQRKRLQESTSKIMLLNRLDEVNFQFCSSDGAVTVMLVTSFMMTSFMMVANYKCCRQNLYVGDFFVMLVIFSMY